MISEVQGLQSLLVNRAESAVNSVGNAEKSSENAEISQAKQSSPNIDEYVPSGEREHTGLYYVSADEQGNSKVKFDAPKTFESVETTINTDSVDREIKSLKEKQTALQMQLKSASPDEAEELRRRLDQLSSELAVKDNDEYRKAKSVVS